MTTSSTSASTASGDAMARRCAGVSSNLTRNCLRVWSIPVCGVIYAAMGWRKYQRSFSIDPKTGKERVIDLTTGDETLREPQAD